MVYVAYFNTGNLLIKAYSTDLRSSNKDQLQSSIMLGLDAVIEDKD